MSVDHVFRKHGVRGSYVKGCRCDSCRKSNQEYELRRRQVIVSPSKGYVPAGRARAHLLALSEIGVGYAAVVAATDIGRVTLLNIRLGKKERILLRTERKILAVNGSMALDRALIDATATWALVTELQAAGFTLQAIAKELKVPRLVIGMPRVTVRRADSICRVHQKLMADPVRLAEAKAASALRQQASVLAVQNVAPPVSTDSVYRFLLDVLVDPPAHST